MVNNITPELVDYLIALVYLTMKHEDGYYIKLLEVSEVLGVAKPTASLMLRKLLSMGLISKSKQGIAVSKLGLEVSMKIVKKHEILEDLLLQHGLDHDRACEIARKLELVLDEVEIVKIEKTLLKARSACDKLQCRLNSAIRARKR